jgi:hypothetical protein
MSLKASVVHAARRRSGWSVPRGGYAAALPNVRFIPESGPRALMRTRPSKPALSAGVTTALVFTSILRNEALKQWYLHNRSVPASAFPSHSNRLAFESDRCIGNGATPMSALTSVPVNCHHCGMRAQVQLESYKMQIRLARHGRPRLLGFEGRAFERQDDAGKTSNRLAGTLRWSEPPNFPTVPSRAKVLPMREIDYAALDQRIERFRARDDFDHRLRVDALRDCLSSLRDGVAGAARSGDAKRASAPREFVRYRAKRPLTID